MTNTGHGSARAPWARGRAKPRSSSIARSPVFERSRGVVQHAHQPWFDWLTNLRGTKKRGQRPSSFRSMLLIKSYVFPFREGGRTAVRPGPRGCAEGEMTCASRQTHSSASLTESLRERPTITIKRTALRQKFSTCNFQPATT